MRIFDIILTYTLHKDNNFNFNITEREIKYD